MKDLTISLFGLVASLIVVAILVFMEVEWGFAFYSVMHLFVVPTGAIVSGMGAAGGYYLGALLLHSRPTPKILLNMVAISIGTYFTLHYAMYLVMEIDGQPLSTIVGFGAFMDVILTNMSMTVGRSSVETGELGNLGYLVALLQVVGFAVGGFAVYVFLKNKPYCGPCNKYYKRVWQDTRFAGAGDNEKLMENFREFAAAFDSADVEGIRKQHSKFGAEKHSDQTHLRTQLTLFKCPDCERKFLSFETSRQKGDNWEVVSELSSSKLYAGVKDAELA